MVVEEGVDFYCLFVVDEGDDVEGYGCVAIVFCEFW